MLASHGERENPNPKSNWNEGKSQEKSIHAKEWIYIMYKKLLGF